MRRIQKVSIVGGTVATLMAGGVAFAAWTSTGEGSGTATAGSAQGLTVTGGGVTGLYPSGDQSFNVTVKNNNSYSVRIDQIELTGNDSVSNGGSLPSAAACAMSDVTPEIAHDGNGTLIAAGGTATINGAVKVTMHIDASDNCQSADFNVGVKATAHSAN